MLHLQSAHWYLLCYEEGKFQVGTYSFVGTRCFSPRGIGGCLHHFNLEKRMTYNDYTTCIDACNACADACDHCAASCLQEDNVQMMSDCIATDIDCAAICRLATGFMARGSRDAAKICQLCAEICERCGQECAKHEKDHCQKCAEACKRCAEECRKMA